MADCLNGGDKSQFTNLDGTETMVQQESKPKRSWGLGRGCAIFYVVLLTAIAVVAFVLGCYATDRVRSLSYPDALLVSDPHDAPGPGYTVYSLGTGLGYWSPTTSMLHPRSDHAVLSYGKYAFLIGGATEVNSNGSVLTSVVRYDTETGVSLEMKELPQARMRFAYALLNNRIYVMGGCDSAANTAPPLNTVFVYDIAGNSWSAIDQLKTARSDACGAAINGKVYVFGGYDSDGYSLASTEVCDPNTATGSAEPTWTLLPAASNMQTSRGDCRAAAVDNLIYAVGGVQYYLNPTLTCKDEHWVNCYRFLDSVEAFDPATQRWSPRTSMLSKRGDFGIEVLPGSRIIVAGGERGNGTQNSMAMYDVEEYIVSDDIWVQKAPLPQARFRDDLAYVAGRVYAFGGTPTCLLTESPNATCFHLALDTVFAYFDIQYPRLYAFYKAAPVTSSANLGRRLRV